MKSLFSLEKKTKLNIQTHLEVITKWPVTQHLKKGMMSKIMSHVIKVIVFSSNSDAFLAIHSTNKILEFTSWIQFSKNKRLELLKERFGSLQ